jgi:hypothetical protein
MFPNNPTNKLFGTAHNIQPNPTDMPGCRPARNQSELDEYAPNSITFPAFYLQIIRKRLLYCFTFFPCVYGRLLIAFILLKLR